MSIDINIYNNNKHWILIILEKIKDAIVVIWRYLINIITSLFRFIKRIWKVLLGLAAIFIIIAIIWLGVDYYYNNYLPQKRTDEAIADLNSKFNSKKDAEKTDYAFFILRRLGV